MKRILGGTCIALAVVGLLAACMPRGKPLTPEETRIVEANLTEMEVRVAEQLQASMEKRGIPPASAEEVIARMSGNTGHTVESGATYSVYFRPDGTLRAKLVTAKGFYRSSGIWFVNEDGIRCVTVDEFRGRFRGISGISEGSYEGRWETSYEENCYEVFYEDDSEHWVLVSGPHYLKSGTFMIMPGNPFDL